ncbi:PEGA domain-containing protein [bacterium]|nr:PEGA domain-containing protein [bacterium]
MRHAAVATACAVITAAGCGTQTLSLKTYPPGAKATINGKFVGITPVDYQLPEDSGAKQYTYKVEKENYEAADGVFTRRVAPGRIVGAVFTAGILLIFRSVTYFPPAEVELQPVTSLANKAPAVAQGSVEERLKKIESLHDKGLLSDQEYKRLRSDVLDELH